MDSVDLVKAHIERGNTEQAINTLLVCSKPYQKFYKAAQLISGRFQRWKERMLTTGGNDKEEINSINKAIIDIVSGKEFPRIKLDEKARLNVELTVECDFSAYSEKDQAALLKAIGSLLDMDSKGIIVIKNVNRITDKTS